MVAARPAIRWSGGVWRMHKRKYPATDPGGSLKVSGRYNRGLDRFPEAESFAALYLATRPETSLGEISRHLTPRLLSSLNDFRLSELSVAAEGILDCRDPTSVGLRPEHFAYDTDYEASQAIGAAAFASGFEGLLVASATRLGDALILFPENMREESRIEAVSSRDPKLYVERS